VVEHQFRKLSAFCKSSQLTRLRERVPRLCPKKRDFQGKTAAVTLRSGRREGTTHLAQCFVVSRGVCPPGSWQVFPRAQGASPGPALRPDSAPRAGESFDGRRGDRGKSLGRWIRTASPSRGGTCDRSGEAAAMTFFFFYGLAVGMTCEAQVAASGRIVRQLPERFLSRGSARGRVRGRFEKSWRGFELASSRPRKNLLQEFAFLAAGKAGGGRSVLNAHDPPTEVAPFAVRGAWGASGPPPY
jgi:hypothetical protein